MRGHDMRRSFPAHADSLSDIRLFVREQLAGALTNHGVDEVMVATSEASANAVRYAGAGRVQVDITVQRDHVEVQVRDEGTFRRPGGEWRATAGAGLRGYGFPLMEALTDSLTVEEGSSDSPGTVVRMIKHADVA